MCSNIFYTLVVPSGAVVEVVALFKIDIPILWVIGIQVGQSLFSSFGDGKFSFIGYLSER